MSKRLALNAALILLSVAMFAPAAIAEEEFPRSWFWHDSDEQWKAHQQLIGKQAPKLQLTGWYNGEVTAKDLKGKIVVVDFWATWCGPCISGIPKNNEILTKYKKDGVIVVGACTSRSGQEKMEQVAKQYNIQYPTARDPSMVSAKAWRVFWYPTYALVDRQGRLRALGLMPNYVEKAVQKLLKEDEKSSK